MENMADTTLSQWSKLTSTKLTVKHTESYASWYFTLRTQYRFHSVTAKNTYPESNPEENPDRAKLRGFYEKTGLNSSTMSVDSVSWKTKIGWRTNPRFKETWQQNAMSNFAQDPGSWGKKITLSAFLQCCKNVRFLGLIVQWLGKKTSFFLKNRRSGI